MFNCACWHESSYWGTVKLKSSHLVYSPTLLVHFDLNMKNSKLNHLQFHLQHHTTPYYTEFLLQMYQRTIAPHANDIISKTFELLPETHN